MGGDVFLERLLYSCTCTQGVKVDKIVVFDDQSEPFCLFLSKMSVAVTHFLNHTGTT